jgi:transcriptional regulator with AbiEi antitoxin domain of type IV toxin-antitoxin system/uncharacterized protein DUF559
VPAGVNTRAALLAAGLSPRGIRRLVREGALRPVLYGVYASSAAAAALASDSALTTGNRRGNEVAQAGRAVEPAAGHLLQVAAVLAVTGSRSVGSHHSAAQAHGLAMLRSGAADLVHVTRSPADRGSSTGRPGIRVHKAALPAGDVTKRRGVPVTSVARTVVDLARTVPFAAGVVVADSALRDKQATRGELETVVARCERWPGIQRARRVVAFADPGVESVLESISRVAFHEHGLPPPELQVWVGGDDEITGRVDFLWRRHRTIAEADGAIKYTGAARALAQLNRDARLREAGFEVVHFTWAEITRVPAQVVGAIRAAFRRQESGTRRE